jgi:hypothetical protein
MAAMTSSNTSSGKKPFLKTAGGMILTGGLGAVAGGLFGKSKLTKQMDASMARIQGLEIAPEMQQSYQQAQSLGNVGMDAASLQIAREENARGQNAAFGALGGRRSALAGIPGLMASSGDLAKRLAAQNAMMKREGKMVGIQSGMQLGQAKMELEKSKAEADYNALSAKKERRAQLMGSIIQGVGSIAGAAIGGGKK